MASKPTGTEESTPKRKRRLRAALAADVANFSGRVSVSETHAFGQLSTILKIGREELELHEGELIGMPGDGLFALFESAVDAVHCALAIQERLSQQTNLGGMRLRIGIHVGDVLFEGDIPFGETLNIAARLESLADPGGILVSGTMVDAVSARISATFEDRGVPRLKNIPRRISTYAVHSVIGHADEEPGSAEIAPLDKTMQLPRKGTEPPAQDVAPEAPSKKEAATAEPVQNAPLCTRLSDILPPDSVLDLTPEPKPTTAPDPGSTKPAKPVSPAPPPGPPMLHDPIPADAVEEIAGALAVYLGPVARVMVTRKAKTARSPSELIETLSGELSSSQERAAFRSRLLKLLGR